MLKPLTVARRQVTMQRIACEIERMEMLNSLNMEGRAEVMFMKAMVTEREGMGGGLSVGVRILIGNANKCKQGIKTMETVGKGGGYQRWR